MIQNIYVLQMDIDIIYKSKWEPTSKRSRSIRNLTFLFSHQISKVWSSNPQKNSTRKWSWLNIWAMIELKVSTIPESKSTNLNSRKASSEKRLRKWRRKKLKKIKGIQRVPHGKIASELWLANSTREFR